MTWTVMLWTALVPWLLLWWVFQRAAGLRGYVKTAVAGLAGIAVGCPMATSVVGCGMAGATGAGSAWLATGLTGWGASGAMRGGGGA